MNENNIVKLIKKLNATDLANEKVMIDFSTGKYFLLKGSACNIWDLIQSDITISEIIDKLTTEYEVDKNTCKEATIRFLEQLRSYDFIEVI